MIEAHVEFDPERDPERTPDGFRRIKVDEVFVGPNGEVTILGPPATEPENPSDEWYEKGHNCDEMGCGSLSHVLIHARIEAPCVLRHPADEERVEGARATFIEWVTSGRIGLRMSDYVETVDRESAEKAADMLGLGTTHSRKALREGGDE